MGRRDDPRRISVQGVTATPMDREPPAGQEGRLYWRARTAAPHRRSVWSGWGTREEAEAAILAALRKGIPAPRGASGVVRTVGDLVRVWERAQTLRVEGGDLAERTIVTYRASVSVIRESLGEILIDRLELADVEDAVARWRRDGGAARTCRLIVVHLSAALAWGAKRGHCRPLSVRSAAPEIRADEYVLNSHTPSRADARDVLDHIPPGPPRDAVELLALTGARGGEIAALRPSDYDAEAGTLRLSGRDERRGRRGKTRPRLFPVIDELRVILDRLAAAGGAPETGELVGLGMSSSREMWMALRDGCDAAGVRRFTPHGLRRMVAMELLDAGVDVRTVSELTGHTVATLLKDYVRPTPPRLLDAIRKAGIGRIARRGKVHRLKEGR